MTCAKCEKLAKTTKLATPAVKKKSEMYYGSSAGTGAASSSSKSGPTLGNTGITKSKLLSKSAKNPYAAYASTCASCKTKTDAGKKYCQRCAYAKNACPICGKGMSASAASTSKAPVIDGQKRTMK